MTSDGTFPPRNLGVRRDVVCLGAPVTFLPVTLLLFCARSPLDTADIGRGLFRSPTQKPHNLFCCWARPHPVLDVSQKKPARTQQIDLFSLNQ